jgi:hypothetical protein
MRVINTRALPADDGIDTTAHLGTEKSGEDHKFAGAESFGGEEETALFWKRIHLHLPAVLAACTGIAQAS